MEPHTKLLHSVWDENPDFLTQSKVLLDQFKLQEVIASVFSNGPYYFYVVDFFDRQIKFMSPLINSIHQLEPETATFQDILDQIHPDDMAFVVKAEAAVGDMLHNKIGKEKHHKYKVSYCFRMKTTDGSYQLFNHQAVILNFDERGRVAHSLNIHTNISHLTTVNNYQVFAIGLFGEPSYLNIPLVDFNDSIHASVHLFSKRETQIIRLLSEGLSSIEIAEKLHIALNTVNSHRKNILKKSGCKNLAQLITKCITEGLI